MLKSSSLCLYSSHLGTFSRWPPLLKIEISLNGQNCSILSQNVPKFELLKHNDEVLNIITGFFMNFELFDYFIKILFLLSKWFQKRRFLWEFPIGSYIKLSSAVAAINHWANCNQTLVE
jgi:hypothetical protein